MVIRKLIKIYLIHIIKSIDDLLNLNKIISIFTDDKNFVPNLNILKIEPYFLS